MSRPSRRTKRPRRRHLRPVEFRRSSSAGGRHRRRPVDLVSADMAASEPSTRTGVGVISMFLMPRGSYVSARFQTSPRTVRTVGACLGFRIVKSARPCGAPTSAWRCEIYVCAPAYRPRRPRIDWGAERRWCVVIVQTAPTCTTATATTAAHGRPCAPPLPASATNRCRSVEIRWTRADFAEPAVDASRLDFNDIPSSCRRTTTSGPKIVCRRAVRVCFVG
jgi:hypothetical protein